MATTKTAPRKTEAEARLLEAREGVDDRFQIRLHKFVELMSILRASRQQPGPVIDELMVQMDMDFRDAVDYIESLHGVIIPTMQRRGSDADVAKAHKARDAAESKLKTEGPKLEADIAKLQQQLDKLKSDLAGAEADIDARNKAEERLIAFAPKFLRERADTQVGRVNQMRWCELGAAKNRIGLLERVGTVHAHQDAAAEIARSVGKHELLEDRRPVGGISGSKHDLTSVNPRAWQEFQQECESELPAARKRVAQLQEQYERECGEADTPRKFFVQLCNEQ